MNWGAAIAQWICRRLPFGCPGFESQAHHLCFYQFKFKLWDVEKTKLNRNIGGDWPIFKKTFVHIGSINSVQLDFDIKRCIDSVKITVVCKQIIQSETTVYLDRLSINYPPISDAFDNREYFLHYTNDSTLTLLRNNLFNINKQNIFQISYFFQST